MGACCPKASAKQDETAPPFTVVLAGTANPITGPPKPPPEPPPKPTPEPVPKPAPGPAPEPAPKPAPKPTPEPVLEPASGGAESPGSDDFEVVDG